MLPVIILALLLVVFSGALAALQPSEGPMIFILFVLAGVIVPLFPALLTQVL